MFWSLGKSRTFERAARRAPRRQRRAESNYFLWVTVTATAFLFLPPAAQAQSGQDREPALPRAEPVQEESLSPAPKPSASEGPGLDYVIGPEDILKIDVFQIPELSNLEARVANDGTITVPLLGTVEASGMTAKQLADALQGKWGEKYLQSPQVSVFVKDYHAKPVSIVGAVEKPGLYYLTGPRTLIEMISIAGGLAKRTSAPAGRTVFVTRNHGGFKDLPRTDGLNVISPDKVEIDLHKLFYSERDALDISIQPLDIISVSKADVVYVGGRGVTRPGGFILEDRDRVSVLQAIDLAQGLSADARIHDARIIRTEQDGSRKMIPVDLGKIQSGKSPDPILGANDILFVPDNSQRAALKKGAATVVQTLSGMLIFGRI
jgi:polysaccharide export outer membrane protein